MIVALDPGQDKCGLAVLNDTGAVVEKTILPRRDLPNLLPAYLAKHHPHALIIGRGHFGEALARSLRPAGRQIQIVFVCEKNSSREARKHYWRDHPPRGWWKLIPVSLRVPPVPVDDYAAVILGVRHLEG